jgi:hypothetical protein
METEHEVFIIINAHVYHWNRLTKKWHSPNDITISDDTMQDWINCVQWPEGQ